MAISRGDLQTTATTQTTTRTTFDNRAIQKWVTLTKVHNVWNSFRDNIPNFVVDGILILTLMSIWPWPKSQTCLLSDVAALLRMAIIQISEGHADAGHKLNSAGWKGRWKWRGQPWKRQKWWWRWFSQLIDIEMCFDIEKLTEIDCTEGGEHSLQGWNRQWRNCFQKWGQVVSEIGRNIPLASFFLMTSGFLLRFASLGDVIAALPHLWVARVQHEVAKSPSHENCLQRVLNTQSKSSRDYYSFWSSSWYSANMSDDRDKKVTVMILLRW